MKRSATFVGAAVMAVAVSLMAGCATTTRIDDEAFSLRRLKQESRGIALMRVGAASYKCVNVGVLLGVRAGEAYRRVKVLGVVNVRSIAATPVAEVELDAGEYHVVGYSCTNDKGGRVVTNDTGAGSSLFRTSYARFSVEPGEVVNVGYLHFTAQSNGDNAFGRPIKIEVEVTDWPLDEIARFERQRPHLYAAMIARHMKTGEPPVSPAEHADVCETWRTLRQSGKAATIPAACTEPGAVNRTIGKSGIAATAFPQQALR
ncbi:MAG: hypothetical protein HC841_05620 [Verrucomicrobiae bacterium]|nr:hypothetical protein [Verrucomicrobiae bacterium]